MSKINIYAMSMCYVNKSKVSNMYSLRKRINQISLKANQRNSIDVRGE